MQFLRINTSGGIHIMIHSCYSVPPKTDAWGKTQFQTQGLIASVDSTVCKICIWLTDTRQDLLKMEDCKRNNYLFEPAVIFFCMDCALLHGVCQVLHLFCFFLTYPLVRLRVEETIRYASTVHGIILYKELNRTECKISTTDIVSNRRKCGRLKTSLRRNWSINVDIFPLNSFRTKKK